MEIWKGADAPMELPAGAGGLETFALRLDAGPSHQLTPPQQEIEVEIAELQIAAYLAADEDVEKVDWGGTVGRQIDAIKFRYNAGGACDMAQIVSGSAYEHAEAMMAEVDGGGAAFETMRGPARQALSVKEAEELFGAPVEALKDAYMIGDWDSDTVKKALDRETKILWAVGGAETPGKKWQMLEATSVRCWPANCRHIRWVRKMGRGGRSMPKVSAHPPILRRMGGE